jgi:Derlin-2/3
MEGFMDAYWQTPRVTRIMTTVVLLFSLAVHLGAMSGAPFAWYPPSIFRMPPQLWRFVTPFFLTGPQLGILFDTYWLYRYLTQLEVGNSKFPKTSDLVWYLVFVGGTIQILCTKVLGQLFPFLPIHWLLNPLMIAITYTVTQDQRGEKAGFYFFTIPAQLVPYAMLGINLLFPNGIYTMIIQLTGLVAAHLHDFLSRLWPKFGRGVNVIATPPIMKVFDRFDAAGSARSGRASYGAEPGPLPDAWQSRGTGHRLG